MGRRPAAHLLAARACRGGLGVPCAALEREGVARGRKARRREAQPAGVLERCARTRLRPTARARSFEWFGISPLRRESPGAASATIPLIPPESRCIREPRRGPSPHLARRPARRSFCGTSSCSPARSSSPPSFSSSWTTKAGLVACGALRRAGPAHSHRGRAPTGKPAHRSRDARCAAKPASRSSCRAPATRNLTFEARRAIRRLVFHSFPPTPILTGAVDWAAAVGDSATSPCSSGLNPSASRRRRAVEAAAR